MLDVVALGLFSALVFVGVALFTYEPADPPGTSVYPVNERIANVCGSYGAMVAHAGWNGLGLGTWALFVLLLLWNIRLFLRLPVQETPGRLFGIALLVLVTSVGSHTSRESLGVGLPVGAGGYLGAWGGTALEQYLSAGGTFILLSATAIAGLLLTVDRVVVAVVQWTVLFPFTLLHRLCFAPLRDHSARGDAVQSVNPAADGALASSRPVTPHAATTGSAASGALRVDDEGRLTMPLEEGGHAIRINRPRIDEVAADEDVEDEDEELVAASAPARAPSAGSRVAPPAAKAPPVTAAAQKKQGHAAASGKPAPDGKTAGSKAAQAANNSSTNTVAAQAPTESARTPLKVNPPVTAPKAGTPGGTPAVAKAPPRLPPAGNDFDDVEFTLPSPQLLEEAEEFPYELLAEKARVAAATLEKTFQEFGLNVRVVEIDTGPVITQFELELEAGLRLSKVSGLADDLAIALRVPSVRVVAPIPGKNTVGVEVPNDKQVMVRLRELLETCPEAFEKKRIPIFLGKDVSGRPLVVDLAKMPHLLIAGRTGTGKSVCLNTLIASILMTRTPDDVRMLMIDPKMVELSPYTRVPHQMSPVITDMKKAEAVLAWAVDKMEERYELLARCGVRHLDSYNEMPFEDRLKRLRIDPDSEEAEQIPERMPYIVIIADEMADMMMTSGKEVEGHIIRLAQKSRAVGIHLVLATQKPTVDVITGLIKSNLPARISFQVASRVDSRVVLDEMGADKLLGNGDMLYMAPGTSKLMRAQGTYISDAEVQTLIDFYGDIEPQYNRELTQLRTGNAAGSGDKGDLSDFRNRDEMYEQAIDIVVREGRGSVSLLQRCLGIGYGRAARLIDYMAEDGFVGEYNGSQAREVLYTPEQWNEMREGAVAD